MTLKRQVTFTDNYDRADDYVIGNNWIKLCQYQNAQIISNSLYMGCNTWMVPASTQKHAMVVRDMQTSLPGGIIPEPPLADESHFSRHYVEEMTLQIFREWMAIGRSSVVDDNIPIFGFEWYDGTRTKVQIAIVMNIRDVSGGLLYADFYLVYRYFDTTPHTVVTTLATNRAISGPAFYVSQIHLKVEDLANGNPFRQQKSVTAYISFSSNISPLTAINQTITIDWPSNYGMNNPPTRYLHGLGTISIVNGYTGTIISDCFTGGTIPTGSVKDIVRVNDWTLITSDSFTLNMLPVENINKTKELII